MNNVKLLSYKELAALLNIKVESAKALRRRRNWRILPANQGRSYLVEVPLSFISELDNGTTDMSADITAHVSVDDTPALSADMTPHVSPADLDRFEKAYREIGELQARLHVAESKAGDYESLKAKADNLETENKVMAVSLQAAKQDAESAKNAADVEKERRQRAEADLIELKGRGFLKRLFG